MESWQQSLANAITNLDELFKIVDIDSAARKQFTNHTDFPLLVTREFANRMIKGKLEDPLLKQVIPHQAENNEIAGYDQDPLSEQKINPVPGLLHRYPGRVLLTLTAACPVHCRFCFRRHFPYTQNNPLRKNFGKILDYINNNPSIEEVIFSGGDPLLVNDDLLADISGQIAEINHVQRLRIHTRAPIFLPSRINEKFLDWLKAIPLSISIVIHCNHPQELDHEVESALKKLKPICQLLNQSVLLAGINDDVSILSKLSRKLFNMGVLPYYLHLLDKVQGAAHFEVDEEKARYLVENLAKTLPGYLVPKLVKTLPEERSKIKLL